MLKALIVGNLGSDPEVKYSANGAPFMRFNVASNGRKKDSDGEWFDFTEWVRVTVIGARVESLQQYLHKGMKVYVDGRLEASPYTDQQGKIRAGLEVVAFEVQFMSARQDDQQGGGYSNGNQQSRQQQPARAPSGNQGQQRNTRQELGLDDEPDLPF